MTSPIDLDFDGNVGSVVNPLQPTAPVSGTAYGDLFQPLFGTLSAENQQEVWVQFLSTYNLSDPPPVDTQTVSLFLKYASDVYKFLENVIVSNENFTVDIPLLKPPTTGFYANALKSYFSDKTPAEQQKIWVQFLLNNNYTTTPPPEDFLTEKLFIDFIATILDSIQNQNVHSPEEVRKRYIMALTLDSLLKMLGSLQDAIGTQSRNLIFYGTWQQEYTKMMARVPTYVGTPDSAVHVPFTVDADTNYDNFTFGYDKISVSDIASWWASNTLIGSSQPFIMSSLGTDPLLNEPLITVTYTPQSGSTNGSISWVSQSGGSGTVTIPPQRPTTAFTATSAQSQAQLAQEEYAKSFKTAFASAWNGGLATSLSNINSANLTAINAVDPNTGRATTAVQPRTPPDTSANSGLQLPWGFSYIVPNDLHTNSNGVITNAGSLSDANAKARGEKNANLQNVIENIRSRRKVIQNLAQQLQSNLDQSRQTVTKQSDLLNSILQSITDLVKAIYKR